MTDPFRKKPPEHEPGALLPLAVGWVFSLGSALRLVDALFLARRPRLLRAYLRTWRTSIVKTPWSDGSFDKLIDAHARHKSLVELTYGETPVVTAVKLLRLAGVGEGARLLDLGSGRGRVLLAARYLGAEAIGVDLLEAHVAQTAPILERVGARVVLGDAEDPALDGVTHVYIAWTCFSAETRARVAKRLREGLAPGARVIVLSHPLEGEGFTLVVRTTALCSWGRVAAYVHERE